MLILVKIEGNAYTCENRKNPYTYENRRKCFYLRKYKEMLILTKIDGNAYICENRRKCLYLGK